MEELVEEIVKVVVEVQEEEEEALNLDYRNMEDAEPARIKIENNED